MDQRLVKPIFWPVLLLSSAALSVTIYFLIGGMISNRLEDYFIAFLVGFILFAAARIVQRNGVEQPKVAIALMFVAIIIAAVAVYVMNHALTVSDRVDFAAFEGHRLHAALADMPRGLRHLPTYRDWAAYLTAAGFDLTGRFYIYLQRAIHLSYGIIAGIVFIVLQVAVCALLFIKTKPPVREFRSH